MQLKLASQNLSDSRKANIKIQPQESGTIASDMKIKNQPYKFNNKAFQLFAGKPVAMTQNGKVVGGITYEVNRNGVLSIEAIEVLDKGKDIGTKAIKQLFDQNPKATMIKGEWAGESKGFWEKLGATFDRRDPYIFTVKRPQAAQAPLCC